MGLVRAYQAPGRFQTPRHGVHGGRTRRGAGDSWPGYAGAAPPSARACARGSHVQAPTSVSDGSRRVARFSSEHKDAAVGCTRTRIGDDPDEGYRARGAERRSARAGRYISPDLVCCGLVMQNRPPNMRPKLRIACLQGRPRAPGQQRAAGQRQRASRKLWDASTRLLAHGAHRSTLRRAQRHGSTKERTHSWAIAKKSTAMSGWLSRV